MLILFPELLYNIPTGKLGLSQSIASKHISRNTNWSCHKLSYSDQLQLTFLVNFLEIATPGKKISTYSPKKIQCYFFKLYSIFMSTGYISVINICIKQINV